MPREGHDKATTITNFTSINFNPRAPRGARQVVSPYSPAAKKHFNPRAPRGARPLSGTMPVITRPISIHVPREGHDAADTGTTGHQGISIHVPREGHDVTVSVNRGFNLRFQSTCPARGTTRSGVTIENITDDFNPRAPRGARPNTARLKPPEGVISIHVPREGHDKYHRHKAHEHPISIHVPREGHDSAVFRNTAAVGKFQSTCPARGTTAVFRNTAAAGKFQSTCPARGTTANMHNFFVQICARVTNIPLKGMPYLQKTYVSI